MYSPYFQVALPLVSILPFAQSTDAITSGVLGQFGKRVQQGCLQETRLRLSFSSHYTKIMI